MKLKIFATKSRKSVLERTIKHQDSVMKIGKRQLEKLAQQGISIQLFVTT